MSQVPHRLAALTGLRAVAALLVVVFHFQYLVPGLSSAGDSVARIVQAGYVGVSLFFVLSGFVLTYTYVHDDGSLRVTRRSFWIARIARIYPMYLVALLIAAPLFIDVAFFHQVGVTHLKDTLRTAILTPLMLQAWTPKKAWMWNGPGWSVSVEAFFYLLFPFVAVALARLRRRQLLAVALVACGAVLIPPLIYDLTAYGGLEQVGPGKYGPRVAFLKFSPLVHVAEFVLGIVTALAYGEYKRTRSTCLFAPWVAALSVAAITLVLVNSHRIPHLLLHASVLAPVFALLVVSVAWDRGLIAGILASTPLVAIGEASYSLYLVHLSLGRYATLLLETVYGQLAGPVVLFLYVTMATAAAIAFHRLVEVPARAWARIRLESQTADLRIAEALRPRIVTAMAVLKSEPRVALELMRSGAR